MQWLEPDIFAAWRKRVCDEWRMRHMHRAERDAAHALAGLMAAGDPCPTDSAVADLAGCCRRTVIRARQKLRDARMLAWRPTWRVIGGRNRRGPNDYQVSVPDRPVSDTVSQQGKAKVRKRLVDKALDAGRQLAALAVPAAEVAKAAEMARARAVRLGLAPS